MDIEESPGSSFACKRLCIMTNMADNILETIFKGKVYSIRAKELFTWTPCFLEFKESGYNSEDDSFLGNVNNLDTPQHDKANSTGEIDDEGVSDTIFGDNSQSHCHDRHDENIQETTEHSQDPFGFYKLLKKPINNHVVEDATSLSHLPCFTHQVSQQEARNADSDHQQEIQAESYIEKGVSLKVSVSANGFTQEHFVNVSACEATTQVQSRFTHNGGSILEVLDDMIKVGRSMGYEMEGCSNDIERIIGLQVVVGALYGTWLPTNSKILIVVIYAPQCFTLKRHLWEYISGLINRWKGETIVLGDFNEVRCEEERFGSIFHQSYAREFNQFISSSGLMEVKIEGYAFTWTHPSATKMNVAQKAKIRWAIEGDENSKFFHGVINKRRSHLAIREVFASGDWFIDPSTVKEAFRDHFGSRFEQPISARLKLNMPFPNRLSLDQVGDLEKDISHEEIRNAVWDCRGAFQEVATRHSSL
nr:RNA-directed DNA polymerase, eukaryota [Tanacetum cinerariifolium]